MDANGADTPGLPAEDSADFSLVLGGPLYQLLRRSHLSDDTLTLVHRRVVAGILIAWLPLLVLSTWEGRAWWGNVRVPFLCNAEVHARFLLALPLLVFAELVIHRRTRHVVGQFVARNLIAAEDMPRVKAAVGFGTASAEFAGRRAAPHCSCLRRRPASAVLPGCRRGHMGSARGGRSRLGIRQSLARRVVAHAGQRAPVPIPARPLVFPPGPLDPLPLADLTHRPQTHAQPP